MLSYYHTIDDEEGCPTCYCIMVVYDGIQQGTYIREFDKGNRKGKSVKEMCNVNTQGDMYKKAPRAK